MRGRESGTYLCNGTLGPGGHRSTLVPLRREQPAAAAANPAYPSDMPCPLPRRTRRVRLSVASPSARPSPFPRRVGVRDFTFEMLWGSGDRMARSPPEATDGAPHATAE